MSNSGCETGCVVLVIVLFVIFIIGLLAASAGKERKLTELIKRKKAYKQALEALKQAPSDTNLRQETLHLGRDYSDYSRKCARQSGETLFDEVALMNDLNAACGGATPSAAQTTVLSPTIEERLAKLDDLKNKGLISPDEYSSKRAQIIEEI